MEFFSTLSSRGVPLYSTIISGVASAVLALIVDVKSLVNMTSAATLIGYAAVASG